MRAYLIIVLTIIFFSCKESQKEEPLIVEEDEDLLELVAAMTGSFNSTRQAKSDTTYYNLTLHMYPIWEERDGHWLYMEQALTDTIDAPFRQLIYRLNRENDSIFKREVYTIPNEALWAEKWKTPLHFDKLLVETIVLRSGCELLIRRKDNNTFIGKTPDSSCANKRRGASYATSEIEIYKNKLIVWDRGYDAEGKQVWGSKKGGYIFERMKD